MIMHINPEEIRASLSRSGMFPMKKITVNFPAALMRGRRDFAG